MGSKISTKIFKSTIIHYHITAAMSSYPLQYVKYCVLEQLSVRYKIFIRIYSRLQFFFFKLYNTAITRIHKNITAMVIRSIPIKATNY